ncbi:MAG: pilus assembly PilX family protein [Lysobacterales bacterium]
MKAAGKNPRGVALLMGLLLLAALSLLAVMTANGMLLQQRMAANFGDRGLALGNADRAVAAARAWLDSRADVERQASCVSGCWLPVAIHAAGTLPVNPEFESAAWWRANSVPAGSHPETGEALSAAVPAGDASRWIIEEIHFAPPAEVVSGPPVGGIGFYRIVGRGTGTDPGNVAVTESVVARPWQGDYEPAVYPPSAPPLEFCRQFDPLLPCGTLAWRQRK